MTLTAPARPRPEPATGIGGAAGRRAGEHELLRRWHGHREEAAREQLIERYLPLARRLARRYATGREQHDDLFQVASLGLVKAIDRFDPGRGLRFTSYAAPTILGELKRHFRDTGWALHVSRSLQERAIRAQAEIRELSPRLGRSPTPSEVAEQIGASPEQVIEALDAGHAREVASLDAVFAGDEGDGGSLEGALGRDDGRLDVAEWAATIEPSLNCLTQTERAVVELRFGEDLLQREIATRLGTSQMQVSRTLRRALGRLRAAVSEGDQG